MHSIKSIHILFKKLIFYVFLLANSYQLTAQNSYQLSAPLPPWQQEVNYTIDVTLNDTEHTLDGFIRMQYHNNSPDTLSFIWIHLWPNAYKNDQTAFSEQMLGNGRTNFYFSSKEQKGYINRLDFRVNGEEARMEDHPQYIDIIRVLLPHPLPPGGQITLSTPFHEQLPFNFSRGGHAGRSYQVTQWYPKPAVYDTKGWHPIPYLDQGEFYSEFGSFDVRITVPQNYIVAATGLPADSPRTEGNTKTLRYQQDRIHDFAWFADRRFRVDHDTLQLASGRIIDVYAYYSKKDSLIWRDGVAYTKAAIRFRSALIGEYPFPVVSVVETSMGTPGGMEYPTITSITPQSTGKALDLVIEHEVGHNWFYGVLASNERRYPWMDEGMNTYYDRRYEALRYGPNKRTPIKVSLSVQSLDAAPITVSNTPPVSKTASTKPATQPTPQKPKSPNPKISKSRNLKSKNPPIAPPPSWVAAKFPVDPERMLLSTLSKERLDQPISTSSEDFTTLNYELIPYTRTAFWMKMLEDSLGTPLFDSAMHSYYRTWQFHHPYPEDFQSSIQQTSGRNLDTLFSLLQKKGPIPPFPSHRRVRPTFLYNARNTDSIDYINIAPAIGYNKYDQGMIGLLLHNYNFPPDNFRFLLAPLYATNSHQLNGLGRLSYTWYPDNRFRSVELALAGARFSTMSGVDSNGKNIFGGFYKIVPSLRFTFPNASARSTMEKWVEWKTYLIGESAFSRYVLKSTDSNYYPTTSTYAFRYLNQLSFYIGDQRVLYPYNALFQVQQAANFYRVNFTGNYFFNYVNGGGMNMRVFAAKFGRRGNTTGLDLTTYEPKLTALRGDEDYTYSNYFIGRNEYNGFASQQILQRDGDLKLRTDLFQGLQGRSANWVASMNFNTTLPPSIIPRWLPLKLFFDVGTYAEAWQNNPPTDRFLYVGGLQLSLFKNVLNIYAPLVYSSDFSNQLRTVPDQNSFWQKISFSLDIQNLSPHKLLPNIPL